MCNLKTKFVFLVILVTQLVHHGLCTNKTLKWDRRMTTETKKFLTDYFDAIKTSSPNWTNFHTNQDIAYKQLHPEYYANVNEVTLNSAFNSINNRSVPLTAFIPKTCDNSSTIFVFFHGGSFISGSLKTYRPSLTHLAAVHGIRIVYVDYGKAPQYPYPVGSNDCLEATKYIIANKATLFPGSENAEIAVFGNSAGGTYASFVANTLTSDLISYQILIYPLVNFLPNSTTKGSFKKFSAAQYLVPLSISITNQTFFQPAVAKYGSNVYSSPQMSPYFGVTKKTPNALIICVELDPYRDQSYLYRQALKHNRVGVKIKEIYGTLHGYFETPSYYIKAFKKTVEYIGNYIRHH